MDKMEKVIKGLELCTAISQDGCLMLCPYKDEQDETYSGFCEQVLKRDALALLKEQESAIKEIEERKAFNLKCDGKPEWLRKGIDVGLNTALDILKRKNGEHK